MAGKDIERHTMIAWVEDKPGVLARISSMFARRGFNIHSLAVGPDGLLYAGTDDGLIQVTEDGGQHWRKIEFFPGIPENTYVADLKAKLDQIPAIKFNIYSHKAISEPELMAIFQQQFPGLVGLINRCWAGCDPHLPGS